MKNEVKYKFYCLAFSIITGFNLFSQKPKENQDSQEKLITICHLTSDYQIQSIAIPPSSLSSHLEHGDIIGGCSGSNIPLSLSLNKLDVRCNGGSDGSIDLNIDFSKGKPNFNIQWSNGATTEDISNLKAGYYSVTVSISNGLSATTGIMVNEPLALEIGFRTKNVSCSGKNDGEISILPLGGTPPYSYVWSSNSGQPGGTTAANLSKGVYRVSVFDSRGCVSIADIAIEEPEPIKVNFLVINESCSPGNDGIAIASATGGNSPYSFQWDPKTNSQSDARAINLSTGNYSVLISDQNGCISSASININKKNCLCKLSDADCGATMISLGQFINCDPVGNASNYQWEFSNKTSGFSRIIQRGSSLTNFHLTWVPGIQYGKSYDVRIKPLVNGVWMEYGPVCQIIIPAPIPYTQMNSTYCGISTTTLNQQLFCDFVAGAQNYQWEFSNEESNFIKIINRGSNSQSFTLGWVSGIQYGKTYSVRVRANVGGEWGNFGEVCFVSLVYPIPTTKVRNSDCGITLTTNTQNIFCDAVAGASDYQWEISNPEQNFSTFYNRNTTNTNFQFAWIPGIQYQTTYDVRVRAKVAGEWAEFGFICQITTPNVAAAPRVGNINDSGRDPDNVFSEKDSQLQVFPNPSKGEAISISLSGFENSENGFSIEVFDILGNKILSKNFLNSTTDNLLTEINSQGEMAPGLYFLSVNAKNKNYLERIIIK